MQIKKGDIVGRISYGKDITFKVINIIKTKDNSNIAILKGVTLRIQASAPINDLEIIPKEHVNTYIKTAESRLYRHVELSDIKKKDSMHSGKRSVKYNGKILHLDGDASYGSRSYKYYKELGLNAVVKNIDEDKQSEYVISLLQRYKPDILVITGHDGMIKNGRNFNDIYNYRNSENFIKTVKQARLWGKTQKELVIFAGACQSYYESYLFKRQM